MPVLNICAVREYFNDRANGNCDRILRTTKNGDVRLVNKDKMDCIDCALAALGCGKYALSNVVERFNTQDLDCFEGEDALKHNFVAFLDGYEKTHSCFKNPGKIGDISQEVLNIRNLTVDFSRLNYKVRRLEDKYIKNEPTDVEELIKDCNELLASLTALPAKYKKHKKETYSKALNFKNCIRARYLPSKGEKPLKGPKLEPTKVTLSQNQADRLNESLKSLRTEVLKNCYIKRRQILRQELDLLQATLKNKPQLFTASQRNFLSDKLQRYEKKLQQFKPFGLYKFSHCTKTTDAHKAIVEGEIRFDAKGFPGAFFSHVPAGGYGSFGIGLSSYIEKTCVNDPVDGKVFPIQTNWCMADRIRYSHQVEPFNVNFHLIPDIWLGAQRGKSSYVNRTSDDDPNRIGVPIHQLKKIQSEDALNYYKDTTLSHLFYTGVIGNVDATTTHNLAQSLRVEYLSGVENTAWLKLIQNSIAFRLPPEWEGNISDSYIL